MRLKITLIAAFVALVSFSKAQENYVKEYASFLVEIEKSIDKKAFSKAWKKRQSAWEQETLTVNSKEELNKLSDELTSNLSPKVIPSGSMPKLKFTGDYEAYGKSLSKFAAALPQETTSINAADFKTTVLAVGQEFKQKEMQARAKKLMAQIKSDFTATFKAVFEDSRKGSFAKIADQKQDGGYSVNTKMKLAESAKITIDEEKIYTYTTDIKLTDDLEAARKVLKQMQVIIKANVEAEYGVGEWLDEAYVDRTVYDYEFKNEIFSVTAKKPSMAIGILNKKDGIYYIRWSVTEPVFKDWKRTNADWNARDGR